MNHPALSFGGLRSTPKLEKPALPVDLRSIPLELISPSATNPRRWMNDAKVDELAASIRDRGLQMPIRVRKDPADSTRFVIVSGHRRFAAHQRNEAADILAIVVPDRYEEADADIDSIVENLQREDVTAIDHGFAFARLIELWGVSQAELARRLAVSPAHVSRMLAVLELPDSVKDDIVAGRINYLEALKQRDAAAAKATSGKPKPATRKRKSAPAPRGTIPTPFGTVKLKRGAKLEELVGYLRTLVDQDKRDAA
jgi:ParB family chromosome partitioning protein